MGINYSVIRSLDNNFCSCSLEFASAYRYRYQWQRFDTKLLPVKSAVSTIPEEKSVDINNRQQKRCSFIFKNLIITIKLKILSVSIKNKPSRSLLVVLLFHSR